eukprot:TRINITY_DN53616_c0_g1_i1.p1 TRINITY_DN53616_c0_g1~~TRINITY_DN53616_c0_g1_i1.p1  ORF type:complete len:684 (-),score=59.96 TRINITY_DN53616_c0_g1_i1:108-2159(-)
MGAELVEIYATSCEKLSIRPNTGVQQAIERAISTPDGHASWVLDLGTTYIGCKGLKPLLPVIAAAEKLGCIRLSSCGVHGDVVLELIETIRDHPHLSALDLANNPIKTPEAERLLAAVRHNPKLVEIVLEGTMVVDIWKKKINSQLKVNQSKALGMSLDQLTPQPSSQQNTPQQINSPARSPPGTAASGKGSTVGIGSLSGAGTPTKAGTMSGPASTTDQDITATSSSSSDPLPMWLNVILHQISEALYEHRYNIKHLLCVFDDPSLLDEESGVTSPGIPVAEFYRGLSTLGVEFDTLLTANNEDEVIQQMSTDLINTIQHLGLSVTKLFKSEEMIQESLRSTAPKIIRIAGRRGNTVKKFTREETEQAKLDRTAYMLDVFGKLTADGKALYQEFLSLFRTHAYVSKETTSSIQTQQRQTSTSSLPQTPTTSTLISDAMLATTAPTEPPEAVIGPKSISELMTRDKNPTAAGDDEVEFSRAATLASTQFAASPIPGQLPSATANRERSPTLTSATLPPPPPLGESGTEKMDTHQQQQPAVAAQSSLQSSVTAAPAPPPPIQVSHMGQTLVDVVFDSQIELEQGFMSIDWAMSGQVLREEFVTGLAAMRCIGPQGALSTEEKEKSAVEILTKLNAVEGENVAYNLFFEHFFVKELRPPVLWFCTKQDVLSWYESAFGKPAMGEE